MSTEDGWLPPGDNLNSHRLPEREEDHCLDDSKLGKGSDGTQLIFGGLKHEHQAVQCPCLRKIIDDGGVDVRMPEV